MATSSAPKLQFGTAPAPAVRSGEIAGQPNKNAAPRGANLTRRGQANKHGCRTSEYTPPGSVKAGLDKDNQPSKLVHEVRYSVPPASAAELVKRFPGVAVVSVGAEAHDHPIAHTSRNIVWEHSVLAKLPTKSKVLDMYGDPGFNERYNKRSGRDGCKIETIAKVITPKDAVRHARWGPRVVGGVERWKSLTHYDLFRNDDTRAYTAGFDVLVGNHVLYYFTLEDVNRLVNLRTSTDARAGITATFTMHRHGALGENGLWDSTLKRGFLHFGEQAWERYVDVQGQVRIVQTNVLTGEKYDHPDTEPFFQNMVYADENGAMTWTIGLGAPEHWVLTFTSCPTDIVPVPMWKDGVRVVRDAEGEIHRTEPLEDRPGYEAPPTYNDAVVAISPAQVLGGVTVQVPGWEKRALITISHPALYKTLCMWMINKPRTAGTLKDLTAKAQREAGMSKLVGGTGNKLDISTSAMTEHIMAAFLSGVEHEGALLAGIGVGGITAFNKALRGDGVRIHDARTALKAGLTALFHVQAVASGKLSEQRAMDMLEHWT